MKNYASQVIMVNKDGDDILKATYTLTHRIHKFLFLVERRNNILQLGSQLEMKQVEREGILLSAPRFSPSAICITSQSANLDNSAERREERESASEIAS